MGLSYSQNFDGVTPPALPSGWSFNAKFATGIAQAYSPPNGLTLSGATSGTRYFGYYGTPDTASNSWTVSCAFWINASGGIVGGGPVFSAGTTDPTSNSQYWVQPVNPPVGTKRVRFFRSVAGGPVSVADVQLLGSWTTSNWYVLTVTGTWSSPNTTVSVQVQDTSTGNYLTSSGAFAAGVATCLTATDTSGIAPGYYGLCCVSSGGGGDVYLDNFTLNSAILDPAFPLVLPAAAPGARRPAATAYQGVLSPALRDAGITLDPAFPNLFPASAPGPRRASNTAYVPVVTARSPVDQGQVQDPYFAAVLPHVARAAARTAGAAYAGIVSPTPKDALAQDPYFAGVLPHLARGAARASGTAYAGLLAPSPADAGVVVTPMPRAIVVPLPKEYWLEEFRYY